MTQDQPQPEKGCHNCRFHYQNGMACDAPSQCRLGTLWELRKPIEPQPVEPRLTAEEMRDRYEEIHPFGSEPLDDYMYTDKEVIELMTAFARQEVEAKDREWREKIQKRIDDYMSLDPGRCYDSFGIMNELENLLKQE